MGKKKLRNYAGAKRLYNILQPEIINFKRHELSDKWVENYFNNENDVVVELGCGKGEYTIALAKEYPDKNFIGIDLKSDRLFFGGQAAIRENLVNVCFVRLKIEFLAAYFPENFFSEGWITFPDPYETSLTGKKRLTSEKFLNIYRKVFKESSCLHLKTDNDILYEFSEKSIIENNARVINKSDDLYETEQADSLLTTIKTTYEQKYLKQSIKIKYIKFSF